MISQLSFICFFLLFATAIFIQAVEILDESSPFNNDELTTKSLNFNLSNSTTNHTNIPTIAPSSSSKHHNDTTASPAVPSSPTAPTTPTTPTTPTVSPSITAPVVPTTPTSPNSPSSSPTTTNDNNSPLVSHFAYIHFLLQHAHIQRALYTLYNKSFLFVLNIE